MGGLLPLKIQKLISKTPCIKKMKEIKHFYKSLQNKNQFNFVGFPHFQVGSTTKKMRKLSLLSLIWFHSAMVFIYSRASNAKGRHNAFMLLSPLNIQEFMNKLFISFICDQF